MKFNANKIRICLFGDVIVDRYKYYQALRLSPEGPAPIVRLKSESLSMGGAGNVAISISNLGFNVELNHSESVNERIENIEFINNFANKNGIKLRKIKSNLNNSIPTKIRYYVDGKQFMREDLEEAPNFEDNLISEKDIQNYLKEFNVVVISDYQKGLISKKLMQNIIFFCNLKNIPLFIDTKSDDISSVKNAFCLKINESEFNNLFKQYKLEFKDSIKDISQKLKLARESANITNLILTLGSRGSIFSNPLDVNNIESDLVDVVDITGAGDAFLAGLTYSFLERNTLNKLDLKNNFINHVDLKFANNAASSVVILKGTVPISKEFVEVYKSRLLKKKKVGFTNGCFDILHLGHLSLLKEAKERCDYLIVGLNSDKSIKKLKGDERPINDQVTRLEILKSIGYIDEVRIFDEETPIKLIKEISPNLLFKGADYDEDEIVGSKYVKSYGGEIIRVKIISGKSTTSIIKKIKNADN